MKKNRLFVIARAGIASRRVFRARRLIVMALLACYASFCQDGVKTEAKSAIEFTPLIDSSGEFTSFGAFPALNNQGEVVFTAARNGKAGVFRIHAEAEHLAVIAS